MSYVCLACGNIHNFQQRIRGYTNWTGTEFIDGVSGEPTDWDDYEDYDSETTDWEEMQCSKCKEFDVEEYNGQQELLAIKWKHLDKTGKWHKDELEEEDRDGKWKNLMVLEGI